MIRSTLIWLWFAVTQIVSIAAALCGIVLMIPLCALRLWKTTTSTVGPKQTTDKWSVPINWIYGNPSSDGVSGKYAMIWGSGVDEGKKVPYKPNSNYFSRAYCWNLRNNTDNLKYVFSWKKLFGWANGPLVVKNYTLPFVRSTRTFKAGWQLENGISVPVLSF